MVGLVFGAPEQGCQPSQYRGEGYGHHDDGQHGLTHQRAQDQPFDQQAHDDGRCDGQKQSGPYRQAEGHQKGVAEIAADQNKVPLGNVKRPQSI